MPNSVQQTKSKKVKRQEGKMKNTFTVSPTPFGARSTSGPSRPARNASHSVAGGPYTLDELREFIHSFDFWEPDWPSFLSHFPNFPDFSNFPNSCLSPQEQGILTAIKLAYYNSGPGRNSLYLKTARIALSIATIALIGIYTKTSFDSPTFATVRKVSAATVSAAFKSINVQVEGSRVNEIVESTMSGMLKN